MQPGVCPQKANEHGLASPNTVFFNGDARALFFVKSDDVGHRQERRCVLERVHPASLTGRMPITDADDLSESPCRALGRATPPSRNGNRPGRIPHAARRGSRPPRGRRSGSSASAPRRSCSSLIRAAFLKTLNFCPQNVSISGMNRQALVSPLSVQRRFDLVHGAHLHPFALLQVQGRDLGDRLGGRSGLRARRERGWHASACRWVSTGRRSLVVIGGGLGSTGLLTSITVDARKLQGLHSSARSVAGAWGNAMMRKISSGASPAGIGLSHVSHQRWRQVRSHPSCCSPVRYTPSRETRGTSAAAPRRYPRARSSPPF